MSNMFFSFSLFGNRYYFTPKFTLVTSLAILMLLMLGIWQWQSAAEVSDTIELINKRLLLDPLHVDDLNKGDDWRFYPIQLQGSFDNEHQILLTNRKYKGQNGFQVLTPFTPSGSSKEILVNRGWIAGDPDKTPNLDIPDGVTITGVLFQPLTYFMLGAEFDSKNVRWPLPSKEINIEKFSTLLNSPLYSYTLLLSPSSQYGFVREWLWLTNTTDPSRHIANARQWFLLAFIVFLAFIFINTRRN